MTDIVKLGDIGRFVSGGTPSRKHPEYYEGSIPWVSTPALNGGLLDESNAVQFITEDAISKSATKLISPHSLLVGLRVGVGKTGVNTVPMCTNQDIVALTDVDDTSWDIRYLSYAVQAKSAYLVSQKQGATITGITTKLLKSLNVRRLDIDMQRRYVSNLDGVKSRIDSCAIQLVKLDELVKSRFVEMFGDPIDTNSTWPRKPIKDFCELRIGPFGSSLHRRDYIEGGHALINPSHIVNGAIVPDMSLTISDERYSEMDPYHLEIGDVVLGRRGEIGRCAVVCKPGLLCGTGSMIVRPKAGCRPDYLQRVISFPSFKDALEANAVGQTMKNLNAKIVGNAVVALPPIKVQDEFASFVERVDKLRVVAEKEKQTLQTLYDSLAQEYFAI